MHPAFVRAMPDPFVKVFARPYVAGGSLEAAVETARQLERERRIASSIDLLGEESHDAAQIDEAMALYRRLLDAMAADPTLPRTGQRRATVSLKPSTFTVTKRDVRGDLSAETDLVRCRENIAAIARHAKDLGIGLTIDMEDHAWVDFTLDCHRRLLEGGLDNVGTVLQSMLFRTKDDVAAVPEGSRIRLVIGIYREPAEIAHTQKRDMKKKLVEYAERLLERRVYLEFATHDEEYLFRFLREVVVEKGVPPTGFEVQMLLGVPRRRIQDDLVSGAYFSRPEVAPGGAVAGALSRGAVVRLYVPFAVGWDSALAYCKRRLNENPNIVWYGLKNLVTGS